MTSNLTPSFYIGKIPILGQIILAPMDGYTDLPFRSLCRQMGSSISISEFINGIDIINGHPHLKTKLAFSEHEHPFAYQIFDDNPERLLKTAQILRAHNPDYIDINMGCSARNVSNRGAGAGLLKDPRKIGLIVSNIVKLIDLPITAKIRLGWDANTQNYLEVARILQESGVSAIAVHARTRKQEYSGSANWEAIGQIKDTVRIPVIGNGDVKNIEDANRMIKETKCDGVMIGRAAIGNPWVFSSAFEKPISNLERLRVMTQHSQLMTDFYGPKIGMILFRKHLTRYLFQFLVTPEIRKQVYSIENQPELIKVVQNMLLLSIQEEKTNV
jgi:tRNA-dihydrouridine synthase B